MTRGRLWLHSILVFLPLAGSAMLAVGAAPTADSLTDHQTGRHAGVGSGSDYVGAAVCGHCHALEYREWRGSHHELAMQPASEHSVLGDFEDGRFDYAGISSKFFIRDRSYRVLTDGPDGELAEFEIIYTFGVEPLQQYLIELPGGRLQALGIAWDSRPRADGGQRWFHLYPDLNVTADHPMHWTGRNQNWNHMCADCHSTGVSKRYDVANDRFETTYAEVNVACEACHGPGREHVRWALDGADPGADPAVTVVFDERRGIDWTLESGEHTARRSEERRTQIEIDGCGRCHGRASRLLGDAAHRGSLLDRQRPVLLEPDQFHPDGQMLAEVFNWASFLQSRMATAGVTCSDCHQPHTLRLRKSGNALCLQCHSADRFERVEHTGHAADSVGAQCSSCHMPAVTFMEIDRRHDHAFRIPRPDFSIAFGVPNACTDCHVERGAEWAHEILTQWFPNGPDRTRDFADALHAARTGAPGLVEGLEQVISNPIQPAIVRASALRALRPWLTPELQRLPLSSLKDADPVVRLSAVEALAGIDPRARVGALAALLTDPVRAVRIETVIALAGHPEQYLSQRQQEQFLSALEDHLRSIELNSDRPEALVRLGNLSARRGEFASAADLYRRALSLEPATIEAWINLADLEFRRSGETQGETLVRQGLEVVAGSADLYHALGLSLIRQQRRAEALQALKAAADLALDNPDYGHALAVALHQFGQLERARQRLENVLQHHPYHRASLTTLALHHAHAGNRTEAGRLAARLAELEPDNEVLEALRRWLGAN